MTLEDLISQASFAGLTIYPMRNGKWQVSVRWQENDGWNVAISLDKCVALREALSKGVKHVPAPSIEDIF